MTSLENSPSARTKRRRATGFGLVASMSVVVALVAPAPASGVQGSGRPSERIVEVNVTNDPSRDNGQPVVAVDPRDRDNLVFVSTNHRPGADDVPDKYHCFASHSRDGGRTWTQTAWPYGDRSMCGDPYLAVDSKGTFYVAFNRLGCEPGEPAGASPGTCNGVPNHVAVARSTDGGRTWSEPVDTPLSVASTPRLRVDTATGEVYAVGGYGAFSPHAVAVSTDQGRTWSPMAPLPAQPFGNQIAVHNGILATATALKVVGTSEVVPGEAIFWVSRDGGRTFTSSLLTDSNGVPVRPPTGPLVPSSSVGATDPVPWVSADPTRTGRFAVMVPRGDDFEVYRTEDAGRTWHGPAVIHAPGAVKPWMEFGSAGLLGVMWRTAAVDAHSVVSFDRGRSFSAPVRVNRATQPAGNRLAGGDEWSRILLDGPYAYVTWSDGRTGGALEGVLSRVPLSRYK